MTRYHKYWWNGIIGLVVIAAAASAQAQPSVTLSAEPQNNYHSLIFTFTQDNLASMEGCHYNLFAADKRSKLATLPGQGLSIATFYQPQASIQIIASPLPHIARELDTRSPRILRNPKVFFRVLLSCPAAVNGRGEILAVRFKTYAQGKIPNVAKLTKSMKYHMRYYDPES